jgi:hypothetical protein
MFQRDAHRLATRKKAYPTDWDQLPLVREPALAFLAQIVLRGILR